MNSVTVKRSLWTLVAMAALSALFFLLAPVLTSDADRLPALDAARSVLLASVGVGALATFLVVMFALPVHEGMDRLKRRFPGNRVAVFAEILRSTYKVVLFSVLPIGVVFGLMNALFLFLHAPSTSDLRVTHLDAIEIHEVPIIGAGAYSYNRPNARVVGNYLAIKDNVIRLGLPVGLMFAEPLSTVDDIEASNDNLFVVAGRDLLAVTDGPVVRRIAELPIPGMRFGRRVYRGGLMPELLLSGNDGTRGYVYEFYPDGTYVKLADTDANIVGAAGCMDTTAVAYREHVVQLRPGYHARLLFRVPQSSGPITSFAARLATGGESADCLWLVATRNGVYSIQDGAASLLIAGVGGNLSVNEDKTLGFQLTDPNRNVSLQISFKVVDDRPRLDAQVPSAVSKDAVSSTSADALSATRELSGSASWSRTVTMNFDSITGTSTGCVDATNYLGSFGVTVDQQSSGTTVSAGAAEQCFHVDVVVPSSANALYVLNNHPVTFALNFDRALSSLTFVRARLNAGPTGVNTVGWRATAYSAEGTQLAQVGEDERYAFSPDFIAPAAFALSGTGIRSVRFVRTSPLGENTSFGVSFPVLDDFVLTE